MNRFRQLLREIKNTGIKVLPLSEVFDACETARCALPDSRETISPAE